jgi:hypothetical protein
VYLVLRPNLLSMYKTAEETKLRHQVNLSDLTAVASRKDPKHRRLHVFSIFSPEKNYHFQAASEAELREWVDLIQREARIEEEKVDLKSSSKDGAWQEDRHMSSSPEPSDRNTAKPSGHESANTPYPPRRYSHTLEYSGNELASASDLSDAGPSKRISKMPVAPTVQKQVPTIATQQAQAPGQTKAPTGSSINHDDDERVVWHGYLLRLKSSKGVRQWRKVWMVLRQKNLVIYKNEEEYRAELVIPMPSLISAVEIDPISKSKKHCMQIIVEDKTYRFCAKDEEILAKCLGAFKSVLARRDR